MREIDLKHFNLYSYFQKFLKKAYMVESLTDLNKDYCIL